MTLRAAARAVAFWSRCVLAAGVAACAGLPPSPSTGPSVADPPSVVTPSPAADDPAPLSPGDALAAFERQQRDAAEAATRQGRWADAIWAWDIVLALRPRDSDAARRRTLAEEAVRATLPDRLARARAARTRGDLDAAARAYLDVLALAPDHAAAADAMREIERERVRRHQLGQPSRVVMARRAPADAGAREPTADERNELEHASMLAGQGEINSAISTLQPLAGPRRGNAALRALLAELYLRQADQLAPTDRAGAIAALERSLSVEPNQPKATQRLRQLREAQPAGAAKPAR